MSYEATKVRLRYDGKVFLPIEPVDLLAGTEVEAVVAPSIKVQEDWHSRLQSLEGAWGNFEFEEPEDSPIVPEKIFH